MKRPVPVVLTSILLALFAAFQLVCMVLMIFTGALILKKGMPPTAGPQPLPPSVMPAFMFGISVLSAAVAVWLILTLIGLVRLRSWARYSVLVVAGLMAGFGGILMLTSFALPFLMPALPASGGQPAPDPAITRIIFFSTGAFYALVTALGVALLVYYNLAKTKAVFALTAPVPLGPPNTSTGRARPTAVTVVSWLYMTTAPFCLMYVLFPIPAFLLGFILHGFAARCVYFFFAVLNLAIGYGLYRLRDEARIAVFVAFAILPIQTILLLTPWGASQFRVAMEEINAAMYGGQQAPANPFGSPGILIFFMLIATALYGVILWLLHRHREAFTPAPPPPPMPAPPEALEGLMP